jgi:hypothetical protein
VLSVLAEIDHRREGGAFPGAAPGNDRPVEPDRRVFFDE